MHIGMSENETIVSAVWLIEEGTGVFFPPLFPASQCSPSYSSTIVHIARSLLTTRPPPPPLAPCLHAGADFTHRLQQCLPHDLQLVLGLERFSAAVGKTGNRLWSHRPWGFYGRVLVFFIIIGETPRHLAHIWSCLMRGSVCLTLYFKPTINWLHSGVVKRLQPSSPLWQKPNDVNTRMIYVWSLRILEGKIRK